MKSWISHILLFSLCLVISCEKSFDSIVPQKTPKPPKPPIIITTAPPSANLMFIRGDAYYCGDIYFLDNLGNETRLTFEGIDANVFGDPPVFSPDGSKIAFVSEKEGNEEIYLMNSDGTNQVNLTNHPSRDWIPRFAPDGSYLIFSSYRDGNSDIYSMNLDGTNKTNLTQQDSTRNLWPDFSPDGTKIAFTSRRDGYMEVYIMDADGSNQQNLTNSFPKIHAHSPLFSPDGSKILYISIRDGSNAALYIMNNDGTDQLYLTELAWGNGNECARYFTHDGNHVIYEQREIAISSSQKGIYIVNIEDINPKLLSPNDRHPCLSPDGSKIVFHSDEELYEMNIDGTEQARLTDNDKFDQWPIYQPVQR